jgi:hypothetical protein
LGRFLFLSLLTLGAEPRKPSHADTISPAVDA